MVRGVFKRLQAQPEAATGRSERCSSGFGPHQGLPLESEVCPSGSRHHSRLPPDGQKRVLAALVFVGGRHQLVRDVFKQLQALRLPLEGRKCVLAALGLARACH